MLFEPCVPDDDYCKIITGPVFNKVKPKDCDYCVTPVQIGLRFECGTVLGLRALDLGLGLDKYLVG